MTLAKEQRSALMKIVGITGNIACGKSSVANYFATQGFSVFDADQIARWVVEPGKPAYKEILARFGSKESTILASDQTIDRRKLREIIFSDPQAKKDLERITHPAIAAESEREFRETAKKGAKLAFYEATLLVETGRYRDFDGLIVVVSPAQEQLGRLIEKRGISEHEAKKIIETQLPQSVKIKEADWVIENRLTPHDLERAAQKALEKIRLRFRL